MTHSTTRRNNKAYRLYTAISIVVFIAFWKLLALWVAQPIIVPSPEATLAALYAAVSQANFMTIVGHSIARMALGFSITAFIALTLGLAAGIFKPLRQVLKPLLLVLKAVPTMAIILLALIWLQSERAPMLVGAIVCFPIIYQNVVKGIAEVDVKLIEMAHVYRVDRLHLIKDIYLPSIKPYLTAALSTAAGLNVKVVIAAEVLSQPPVSIGESFQIARANLDTATVFAWAIIAILIAASFDYAIKLLSRTSAAKAVDSHIY